MQQVWRALEVLTTVPWGATEQELRALIGSGADGLLPQIQMREVYIYIYIYIYIRMCAYMRALIGSGADGLLPQVQMREAHTCMNTCVHMYHST